jgi:hypothetical protein
VGGRSAYIGFAAAADEYAKCPRGAVRLRAGVVGPTRRKKNAAVMRHRDRREPDQFTGGWGVGEPQGGFGSHDGAGAGAHTGFGAHTMGFGAHTGSEKWQNRLNRLKQPNVPPLTASISVVFKVRIDPPCWLGNL